MVMLHVPDVAVVEPIPGILVLDALRVEDKVSVAVSSREIFQKDVVPVHSVDVGVGIGNVANKLIADPAQLFTEKLDCALFEPAEVHEVVDTELEGEVFDLAPVF